MDYTYENLGPDRFQQLCQSLLVREFREVQCFPVAQPDGGRDAISYVRKKEGEEGFIVFQVKFVRSATVPRDVRKWLKEVLEGESPKIKRLIPKGALKFYLLTNVPATAHLERGSVDRVNELFRDAIPVPAFCWWRDDLNRRLDSAWDLKWVFPELLSGQDMLRVIIEAGLKRNKARTTRGVQASIRTQYENDRKIRFKQVELHNDLIQLFVDVPAVPRALPEHSKQVTLLRELGLEVRPESMATHYQRFTREESMVGATDLLLNPTFQELFPQVVLEGAPGQGKSTLAQYICQAYRMRLLRDYEAIALMPRNHVASALRIPFRIDLRDFAAWLAKQNPFSGDPAAPLPHTWQRSLESFMAAQIEHYSGGVRFTVDDLHELCSVSALLIVLDGFDEVAEPSRRDAVVKEIVEGAQRLRDLAAALQVIVTSRPTAFANARSFPEAHFAYFTLAPLTRSLISAYADKWLRARRLEEREANEVRQILAKRLEQPHLRELARNPMQLTILLSLIHTRGVSLPDKRTALYDSYVTLFFDREAEKSEVVREHRDLLLDIHRYLGWRLHGAAETGRSRGAIAEAAKDGSGRLSEKRRPR